MKKINWYRIIVNILLLSCLLTTSYNTNNIYSYKPITNFYNILPKQNKFIGLSKEELYNALLDNLGDSNLKFGPILDDCSTIYQHVWKYSSGFNTTGYHLGNDYAAKNKSNVYAPINGYIIREDHSYANYPNEGAGKWLAGGGNILYMIGEYNNEIYGFIFMHLSTVKVAAGDVVRQGDIIALSGNSGTSYTPHCHLEMYKLGDGNISDFININYNESFGCRRGYAGYLDRCDNKKSYPCMVDSTKYIK